MARQALILDNPGQMNTPAHLLLGAAVLARNGSKKILCGALIGGLLPDLSLYVMAGVAMFVLGIAPNIVFEELYFSPSWQAVFAVDNSFFVWGIALLFALKFQKPFWVALSAAGLLHLLFDITLHHDDARLHFWPLSNWRFESPLSYWDSNHFAHWIAPIEGVICALAAYFLVRTQWHIVLRVFFVVLLGLEMFVIRNWLMFF